LPDGSINVFRGLLIHISGGVPKNFIQQTEATVGDYSGSDSYPIQHNTDAPHYIRRACHLSGLSGCTFEEAVSWGKVERRASKVQLILRRDHESASGGAGAAGIGNKTQKKKGGLQGFGPTHIYPLMGFLTESR
jgi:hypothetical protein